MLCVKHCVELPKITIPTKLKKLSVVPIEMLIIRSLCLR